MHAVLTNFAKPMQNVKMTSETVYIQLHWPPFATALLNTRIC